MRQLSVAEQRYQAVLGVISEGRTVCEVAAQWHFDRRTVHRWLARYEGEGLDGLRDGSHRPQRCPHQIAALRGPCCDGRASAMRRHAEGCGRGRAMAVRTEGIARAPRRCGSHHLRAALTGADQSIRWAKATMIPSGPRTYAMRQMPSY